MSTTNTARPFLMIVAREYPPRVGGLERQMELIGQLAEEQGCPTEIWTASPGPRVRSRLSCHVRPRWFAPMPIYLSWLVVGVAFRRLRCLRTGVVVIVARASGEAAILCMLRRVLRIRVVGVLVSGSAAGSELVAQRRRWVTEAVLTADALVFHTQRAAEEARTLGYRGLAEVIPPMLPGRDDVGCPERLVRCAALNLFWCGRNDPVKNLDALFRIFSGELADDATLTLIIDRAPEHLPAGARTHVACVSPRAHLGAASALLLTSMYEDTSNAMVEAASEGVPTVAYASGGTPEAIRSLDCGETVPPSATDHEFAQAVRRVASKFADPAVRSALQGRTVNGHVIGARRSWIRLIEGLGGFPHRTESVSSPS